MTKDTNDSMSNSKREEIRHQVFLTAWVQSRLEIDKQLILLSTLGLGFLVSFRGDVHHICSYIVLVAGGAFYVLCIVLVLLIYWGNSRYIEAFEGYEPDKNEEKKWNSRLSCLMLTTSISFILAIVMSAAFFLITMEEQMAKKKREDHHGSRIERTFQNAGGKFVKPQGNPPSPKQPAGQNKKPPSETPK